MDKTEVERLREWVARVRQADAFVVLTNSDLTEGRGREVFYGWSHEYATAVRLAKGRGVMGTDARVIPVAVNHAPGCALSRVDGIDREWFVPAANAVPAEPGDAQRTVDLLWEMAPPSIDDRLAAVNRAREALSEADLRALGIPLAGSPEE